MSTESPVTIEQVLDGSRDAILAEANEAVARAHLASYEKSGAEPTANRLRTLFEVTSAAVAERRLGHAIEHARRIAHDRYHAGFDLGEVQTAINVLEEAIWRQVLARVSPTDQAQALGLVSTVLGAIKDTLARTYVEHASRTHAPTLDLRALFDRPAK